MNDFGTATYSIHQVIGWIKHDLEESGYDEVLVDPSQNFFCLGEGTPDPFDGFRMVCSQPFHTFSQPLWNSYANR